MRDKLRLYRAISFTAYYDKKILIWDGVTVNYWTLQEEAY